METSLIQAFYNNCGPTRKVLSEPQGWLESVTVHDVLQIHLSLKGQYTIILQISTDTYKKVQYAKLMHSIKLQEDDVVISHMFYYGPRLKALKPGSKGQPSTR